MMTKNITLPHDICPLVLQGDVIEKLKQIPSNSIDVIITSPPYWGQRDYGVDGQLGAEENPKHYIEKMLNVADELKRVLKEEGVYFLNIGDKYLNKDLQMIPFKLAIEMQNKGWVIRNVIIWRKTNAMPSSIKDRFSNVYEPIFFFTKKPNGYSTTEYFFNLNSVRIPHKTKLNDSNLQQKLFNGVIENELPLTLSVSQYNELRNKLVHSNEKYHGKFKNVNKINLGASPGARLSVNGEYYSKQRKYKIGNSLELEIIHYIKDYKNRNKISTKEIDALFNYKDTVGHWFRTDKGGRSLPKPEDWLKLKKILKIEDIKYDKIMTEEHYVLQTVRPHEKGKNPGDVWDFSTGKLQDSHFAVFPEELPKRIILACCPENGIVLDPFVGSGTTLKVAKELNRKSIGIELQSEYLKIIEKRCGKIKIL